FGDRESGSGRDRPSGSPIPAVSRRRTLPEPRIPTRASASPADLDLPRLGVFGLGQDQGQHAVFEGRLGLVGVDRRRQRERALERAEPALTEVPALAFLLLLGLGLALDG